VVRESGLIVVRVAKAPAALTGLLLAALLMLLLWTSGPAQAHDQGPQAAPTATVPAPGHHAHPITWDRTFLPLLGGFGLVVLGAGTALLLANRQRGRGA
jgi:hypothetical protein